MNAFLINETIMTFPWVIHVSSFALHSPHWRCLSPSFRPRPRMRTVASDRICNCHQLAVVAVVLYFIPSSTSTRCGAGGSGGRAALLGSCALASCRLDSPADVRCRGTLPQGANNGRFMADIIPRCSLCSTIPDLRPVPLWGSCSVQK